MSRDIFGHMPSGEEVSVVSLRGDSLRARVIGYGAALADLEFNHSKGWRRLVLGLPTLQDYLQYSPHFGATAGRYAGRIRDGRITIDGKTHQLPRNTADGHHVHGGTLGLGKRNWSLIDHDDTSATFGIVSPDGDEGYPGTLATRCSYKIAGNALTVEMTATTDAATPVNLLHHSYFNLDGQGTIKKHQLMIAADARAVTGADGLPTGEFAALSGDDYDFRHMRSPAAWAAYDVSYVLRKNTHRDLAIAAVLASSAGDLKMSVSTTEPALHFYDG